MNQIKAIVSRVQNRREQYQTIVCRKLPDLSPITSPQILGHYSRTDAKGKKGERKRYVLLADSIRIDGLIETPTSIARDYLVVNKYHPHRMRGDLQYQGVQSIIKRFSFTPSLAVPGHFEDGFYIDLKAAYFSIMALIGWDVIYSPGHYIGKGRSIADFPFPQHKIARNSLMSAAQPRSVARVNPPGGRQNVVTSTPYNPMVNLQLIALTSDILHSIAANARSMGAVYVNTDGYIAPTAGIAASIQQMIADFGFSARVKFQGPGIVNSIGSYAIGDFATRNIDRTPARGTHSNIAPPEYSRWLQRNLEYMAGIA